MTRYPNIPRSTPPRGIFSTEKEETCVLTEAVVNAQSTTHRVLNNLVFASLTAWAGLAVPSMTLLPRKQFRVSTLACR